MSDAFESLSARPKLEARRRAFLEAANALFMEKGYAGSTLDDVIAHSGGSRQTLYTLFGGKQGLFDALVAERSASIFEPYPAFELCDRMPEDVLPGLSARFLTIITTPEALATYRLVVTESATRTEIAEVFWRSGPGNTRKLLSRYFATLVKRGVLRLDNAEQAAGQFVGMLLGTLHMETLLGLRSTPTPAEIEANVGSVVKQFFASCRVAKGSEEVDQSLAALRAFDPNAADVLQCAQHDLNRLLMRSADCTPAEARRITAILQCAGAEILGVID